MVLVDTSVWIDHFRNASRALVSALHDEVVVTHPFVVGELSCGNLQNRKEILSLLDALPHAGKAEDDELLAFVEQHALMGKGIGLIDMHLLASCYLDSLLLWTRDRRLGHVAREMDVEFVRG